MKPYTVTLVAVLLAGCASLRSQQVTRPSIRPAAETPPVPAAHPPRSEPNTLERRYPDLRQAIDRAVASPTAGNRRRAGHAYLAAGILDQAYDQYAAAARLDPGDASAWDGMARIWRDWGFPGLALPDAIRAVFHAPASSPAHNTLGTVLFALGRREEARVEFERALSLDPSAAYAANNVCYSHVTAGTGDAAVEACRLAVSLAPGLVPAGNNLALAYAARGDVARARYEFTATGGAAAGAYNLGVVYMGLSRYGAAEAAFRSAASGRDGLPAAAGRAVQARRLAEAHSTGEDVDVRR